MGPYRWPEGPAVLSLLRRSRGLRRAFGLRGNFGSGLVGMKVSGKEFRVNMDAWQCTLGYMPPVKTWSCQTFPGVRWAGPVGHGPGERFCLPASGE
jgi:hypothetical protein